MEKQKRKYKSPDILPIFFEDMARSPIIGGKHEYLPLTRRVERGRMFLRIQGDDDSDTLRRLRNCLNEKLNELDTLRFISSKQLIDSLSNEIEKFLDHSEWDTPPSLVPVFNNHSDSPEYEKLRLLGWECSYLLAIFPSSIRTDYESQELDDVITSHFKLVLEEYHQSKQTLLNGTLRYVVKLSRHYIRTGVPYMDLIQEGFLGLIQAIDKFEEWQGAHFQSYAASWIKQRITRYVADNSRLIRVPVHQHEKTTGINQNLNQLTERLGYTPSDLELFLAMEWLSSDDVSLIHRFHQQHHFGYLIAHLEEYRQILQYRDKPLSEIPEQLHSKVIN